MWAYVLSQLRDRSGVEQFLLSTVGELDCVVQMVGRILRREVITVALSAFVSAALVLVRVDEGLLHRDAGVSRLTVQARVRLFFRREESVLPKVSLLNVAGNLERVAEI